MGIGGLVDAFLAGRNWSDVSSESPKPYLDARSLTHSEILQDVKQTFSLIEAERDVKEQGRMAELAFNVGLYARPFKLAKTLYEDSDLKPNFDFVYQAALR